MQWQRGGDEVQTVADRQARVHLGLDEPQHLQQEAVPAMSSLQQTQGWGPACRACCLPLSQRDMQCLRTHTCAPVEATASAAACRVRQSPAQQPTVTAQSVACQAVQSLSMQMHCSMWAVS